MKSLFKKLSAIGLTVAVSAGAGVFSVGCGGNGGNGGGGTGGGNSGDLQISALSLGYGTEWLTALEKAFETKTGKSVVVKTKVGNESQASYDNELESLASDTDIFFTKRGWFAEDVYKGKISVKGTSYDCLYADLTDVWESVAAEGETKTIKQKMDATYADALNIEGKYYNLPWAGGVYGIVRNVDVWNDLNLTDADVPYTTDELFALCDKVKGTLAADQKAPFIYSGNDEYYTAWSPIFFGQYEGKQNVENFMDGIDPDGNMTEYIYTYDGHREGLKVLETLLDPGKGYQHGATSLSFTDVQGWFLEGEALFCVNGSWLENEMKENYSDANIDMIKTPVISSLVDKLSFKEDSKLKEVIQYVDAVDAGENAVAPAYATEEDIKIVTEARHYSYMAGGVDHRAYVPAYSNQIDLAKEFLKFMYSDEGLNIYYETLKGTMLPATPTGGYNADGFSLSGFRVSANKAQQEGFVYNREPKSRFFVLNNLSTCYQIGGYELVDEFTSVNGKSANELMDAIDEFIAGKWSKYSSNLGLS